MGEWMKRLGMAIKLRPGFEEEYKRYHAAVWPEVLSKMSECNIRNYSVFFKDNMLFGYLEYHGADIKEDWAKMAADPRTQEWWAIMGPMQEALPTRNEGEWWAEMEEVFHLD
jgi:L-rhamnose mutarotase